MWKTRCKKMLSLILCMVLIAAMALCTIGCKDNKNASGADAGAVKQENLMDGQESENADDQDNSGEVSDIDNTQTEDAGTAGAEDVGDADETVQDSNVLGEGETEFLFTVTDVDGNETSFTIHTDKKLVGEALQDVGLIDGEAGPYGLYVKTVNGITLDFDTDGKYWAFYVDGEYGMAGVDTTEIVAGTTYSFKAE